MQKEKTFGNQRVSVTTERAKRTAKKTANATASESDMTSEMRNRQHSGQKLTH